MRRIGRGTNTDRHRFNSRQELTMNEKPNERTTSSRQDGEDPNFRSDTASEIARPGLHGGAGAPGWKPRPNNREVENEMVQVPAQEGKPPRPATEPSQDAPQTHVSDD
jgi:hypothetical protein